MAERHRESPMGLDVPGQIDGMTEQMMTKRHLGRCLTHAMRHVGVLLTRRERQPGLGNLRNVDLCQRFFVLPATRTRHNRAAPTETMHAIPSAITQCSPASVPCRRYGPPPPATTRKPASDRRHVLGFTRDRSRLETKTATMRSSATVPIPTQNLL